MIFSKGMFLAEVYFIFDTQDPCLITNESGYEPYDRLRNISGAVMWPDDLDGIDEYKDTDGAMLGYVSFIIQNKNNKIQDIFRKCRIS